MLPKLPAKQPRIVWLDVLRLCAIFMVICIHCSDPFNVSPEARSNPEFNLWGGIYGSFLRPCVPLFVMITGILLLPVKMSFEDFYKKRLLRIAVPFLVCFIQSFSMANRSSRLAAKYDVRCICLRTN